MTSFITRALRQASTSVERDPTDAQKEAGNYAKGHLMLHGLDITLENPKGSYRSGVGKDGKRWKTKLPAHYGYVKGTKGKDGDHVDVYVGPKHASKTVFVVDQVNTEDGKFDEHKCLLCYGDEATAVADYAKAFSDGKGKDRIGAVTALPLDAFKAWLKAGDTKKPLGMTTKAYATGGSVPMQSPMPSAMAPDMPSGEPLADLFAQMKDMALNQSQRQGVFVPGPSVAAFIHSQNPLITVGVPIPNFDGQGGLLICKDRMVATEATAARDHGASLQAIIGILVGAGQGKPADGSMAVQQLDPQGAVTRESLVRPHEVPQTAQSFAAPGRAVNVTTPQAVIARRAQGVAQDHASGGGVGDMDKNYLERSAPTDQSVIPSTQPPGSALDSIAPPQVMTGRSRSNDYIDRSLDQFELGTELKNERWNHSDFGSQIMNRPPEQVRRHYNVPKAPAPHGDIPMDASGGRVGMAGGGEPNWRMAAAPYGFAQLAQRLGMTPEELMGHPEVVASAVAQMEDPRGANHVAESFMDMLDRNGGGQQGLLKTIAAYDTMLMSGRHQIGSLARGDVNSVIAGLNPATMEPTWHHLMNVRDGTDQRVLPEGYTQNFSPTAIAGEPYNHSSWGHYHTPEGHIVYAPNWAAPAIQGGHYVTTPSGEYMVPDMGQKPFQVAWSKPSSAGTSKPTSNILDNSAVSGPDVGDTTQSGPENSSIAGMPAPMAQPMALGNPPPPESPLPAASPASPPPSEGPVQGSVDNGPAKTTHGQTTWVQGPLGLMPKWDDGSTPMQEIGP